jgi:hypothetical protein
MHIDTWRRRKEKGRRKAEECAVLEDDLEIVRG